MEENSSTGSISSYTPQVQRPSLKSDSDSESELDDSDDDDKHKGKTLQSSSSAFLASIKTISDLVAPPTPRQPPPRQDSLTAKISTEDTKPPTQTPTLVKQPSSDTLSRTPSALGNLITVDQLLAKSASTFKAPVIPPVEIPPITPKPTTEVEHQTQPYSAPVKLVTPRQTLPSPPRTPSERHTPRQHTMNRSPSAQELAEMSKSQIEQLIDRKVAEKLATARLETQPPPPRREFYKAPEEKHKKEKSIIFRVCRLLCRTKKRKEAKEKG